MVVTSIFIGRIQLGHNKNKLWPQVVTVFAVSLHACFMGLATGWTSPSIPKLVAQDSYIPMSFEKASYFAILQALSMILFSPVGAILGDIIGRKKAAICISILELVSWILVAYAKDAWVLLASRIPAGMADAIFLFTLPVYIAEVTEKHIRGRLGIMVQLNFCIGNLIINLVGYYLSIPKTALLMALLPFVHIFVFYMMPESPYWLVHKNRSEEARKHLQLLRWREDVDDEFNEISKAIEKQFNEKESYRELFAVSYNRKAFLIALIARISQQLSGSTAISGFMQYIFEEVGGEMSRHVSATICASLSVLIILLSVPVIDNYGRKPLILLSSGGCSAVLFGLAIFFYLKYLYDIRAVSWLPLVFMLSFIAFYSAGLSMIPTMMLGEIFSANVKSKAVILITFVYGGGAMFATKIFQVLVDHVGFYAPFLFFGITTAIFTTILYCTFVETKNKSLDEIQDMLKNQNK
ncbi:facilitated trehalose transporter Tret1-like [Agrilus planipennis]|uniref:Facilitated trehalose transporter Tret1-like n=1 Tax=Agrilus planipennis TaxID=224129 RepID=A0A1W4WMR4_AGRPL|nr:facilitated trehalose transporter Tret1-like [Agrilus planipennis]